MKTIYTERKNLEGVRIWAAHYFDAYKIVNSTGVWKGAEEASVKITGKEKQPGAAYKLAATINARNDQECVLIKGAGAPGVLYKVSDRELIPYEDNERRNAEQVRTCRAYIKERGLK